MKEEKIGKHTVMLYESIDELPIKNYIKFNKYYLIDANIGSDIGDFDRQLGTLRELVETNSTEKAVQLIHNIKQLFWFVSNETNVRHMSWACFVHSIDGEKITDYSPGGIKRILDALNE